MTSSQLKQYVQTERKFSTTNDEINLEVIKLVKKVPYDNKSTTGARISAYLCSPECRKYKQQKMNTIT
jgi:hypothetical protein